MKSCEKFRALIPQYAAGELDNKSAAKLQRHIAKCPDCSALLDAQLSGKLHILTTSAGDTGKRKKTRRIILASAATLCLILICTAVYLRSIGFVRIASVTVEELSAEYIQSEYPQLIISGYDVILAEDVAYVHEHFHISPEYEGEVLKELSDSNTERHIAYNYDDSYMHIYYTTAFTTIRLSWEISKAPSAENMTKSIYSRFKIFDIIKETRYTNHGNEHFSEYTATLDLWGTLTRQELD